MAIAKRKAQTTTGTKTSTASRSLNYKALLSKTDTPAVCLQWSIRLLLQQNLVEELHDLLDLGVQLHQHLGFSEQLTALSPAQLKQVLQQRYKELSASQSRALPQPLASNIASLSSMLGLSACDETVLAFAVLQATDPLLHQVVELIPPIRKSNLAALLANLFDLPIDKMAQSLADDSALFASGLLTLPSCSNLTLEDAFAFVSDHFEHALVAVAAAPTKLLKEVMQPASEPGLQLEDYPHLTKDLQIALPYLKQVLCSGKKGVNILFYGPPGTGKSELARVLAQQLKTPLFEVSSEDHEGDAINGAERLRAYRLAQRCLAKAKNLLLFDEIEDVFRSSIFGESPVRKGWINRTLEQNPVPCIWITNDISELDPAFIRRFDQIIALETPPKAQRAKQLQLAASDLLSDEEALALAVHPALTPAIISRAAQVVSQLPRSFKQASKKEALGHLMQQTLSAQGYDTPPPRNALGPVYDASLVNCDVDLSAIIAGLQRTGSGRLCLYGPPGTGKTAFCHYLAKTLQLPLVTKSASELLGKYVGETERNIADAFAEAKEDGAILLLDEVDSFLRDRQQANHSWEITAVNEMLVQMEAFDGIFVASTNLLHNLDQASLRRFDLKACFKYLSWQQSGQLLKRYCQELKLSGFESAVSLLKQSQQLTPGDFAAVARQSRFRPMADASVFVTALLSEVALKAVGESKSIGFLRN